MDAKAIFSGPFREVRETSSPEMAADAPALAVDEALVGARHKSTLSTGAS
jgi:hypothetical protein